MTQSHTDQVSNILAHLESNHHNTVWQTERGFNDSLQAIEYASSPIIAAAPELLEALKHAHAMLEASDIYNLHGGGKPAREMHKAAIAKAEGAL